MTQLGLLFQSVAIVAKMLFRPSKLLRSIMGIVSIKTIVVFITLKSRLCQIGEGLAMNGIAGGEGKSSSVMRAISECLEVAGKWV